MNKKTLILIGGILIALGPLRLLTGTAYILMLPNIYEGTSILKVEFPKNSDQQYTKDALVALTRQKAELIRTTDIFFQVIKQYDLQNKWGYEGKELPLDVTLKILGNKLKLTTDEEAVGLIRITVQSTDPKEASEISTALIDTFKQSHADVSIIDFAHANHRPVYPDLFKEVLLLVIQAILLIGVGTVLLILGLKKKQKSINRAIESHDSKEL